MDTKYKALDRGREGEEYLNNILTGGEREIHNRIINDFGQVSQRIK